MGRHSCRSIDRNFVCSNRGLYKHKHPDDHDFQLDETIPK